jgi:hypothetical protein
MNSFLTYAAATEHVNDLRRQAAEASLAREARPPRQRRRRLLTVLRSARRLPQPVGEPVTIR